MIKENYIYRFQKEIKKPQKLYRDEIYSEQTNQASNKNGQRNTIDPYKTLHFKRRLVDHFFWLLADLRFNPDYPIKISKKQLRRDFSQNERYLFHILHHMNNAAKSEEYWLDAKTIDNAAPDFSKSDDSPMAKYREKLYKEAKHWEKR